MVLQFASNSSVFRERLRKILNATYPPNHHVTSLIPHTAFYLMHTLPENNIWVTKTMMQFLIWNRGKEKAEANIENFAASIIFLLHEGAVSLVTENDRITRGVTKNRNK